MDNIFEIRDGEIDTDEIINKIKTNIEKRKSQGAYTQDDETKVNTSTIVREKQPANSDELSALNDYWDISYNYTISSHRKIAGPVLIKGRQIVNSEVKRYVDPFFRRQKEFNHKVAHALPVLNDQLDRKIEEANAKFDERIAEMERSLRIELNKELDRKLTERIAAIDDDINKKAWLASILIDPTKKTDTSVSLPTVKGSSIDYLSFTKEIGKSWIEISGMAQILPNIFDDAIALFMGCDNVLDIGCGSGYFLGLLKARGVGAYGIEINDDYVAFCLNNELNVRKADAISHLRSLNDNSLGGIFISQVIEHLPIEDINEIVKLCYIKMRPGAYLIITTPNIISMLVSSNLFYLDPTHISRIHPAVLRFVLKSCGFTEIEDRFYNKVPESNMLKQIPVDCVMSPDQRASIEIINDNIDMLNHILFGYRDYAVIALKG